MIWYKPTFDISYAKRSPGEVLLKILLEYALEHDVAKFDFTIGDEDYKYRFANHSHWKYTIRVFRHPLPYYMDRCLLDAKSRIKHFPLLARLSRQLVRHWSNLRWY